MKNFLILGIVVSFFYQAINGDVTDIEDPKVRVLARSDSVHSVHSSNNDYQYGGGDLNHDGIHSGPQWSNDQGQVPYKPKEEGYVLKEEELHGYPPHCVEKEYSTCNYMVSIIRDFDKGKAIFTLSGKLDNPENGYVAIGLSEDEQMGNDDIVECVKPQGRSNQSPILYHSWAKYHEQPVRQKDDSKIVKMLDTSTFISYNNVHNLTCKFERPLTSEVKYVIDGKEFSKKIDLSHSKTYKILLATGQLKSGQYLDLGQHKPPVSDRYDNQAYVSKTPYFRQYRAKSSGGKSTIPLTNLIAVAVVFIIFMIFSSRTK